MPPPINKVLQTMLLPAFLLFANALFSQIQTDTLTKIISYGLGVYAKDNFSFNPGEQHIIDSISRNAGDIPKTIGFLKTNSSSQLKKVGGNVEKWLDKGNTVTAYQSLVKEIEATLTNGGDGPDAKEWRKKNVPGLFTAPVNAYLSGAAEATESEEPSGPQMAESLQPDDDTPISKTTGGNNMLSTIALVLAILSLTGVLYLLFLINSRLKAFDGSRKRQRADIDQLKSDVNQVRTNPPAAATATKTVSATEERLKQLEAKMALFESRLKPATVTAPPRKITTEPVAVPIPNPKKAPVETESETKTFFAKRPDLDNGFKQSDFSTNQNGEQVYQIEIKGNTATFMIVNDAHSQKYALSNYQYYLGRACDFLNEPMPNCRIDTKEYGQLEKTGNDWIIQKKAIIEFV